MSLDALTLAVVRGALDHLVDEMDAGFIRSALSPIISDTHDCACGFFHPRTFETVGQGAQGLPVFIANLQGAVRNVAPAIAAEGGLRPGDVWITNDPYLTGTHLNDVCLIAPAFVGDRLIGVLANCGHWMDLGGSRPGGWVPDASDVRQEGIIVPPLRIVAQGRVDQPPLDLMLANSRLPAEARGDLAAGLGALARAQTRIEALVGRFGADTLEAAIDELLDRSEAQMTETLRTIPPGTYRFSDVVEGNDGAAHPLRIALALTVDGGGLEFDFAGTAPSAPGPYNVASCTTASACFIALKHIFPELTMNGGAFRVATIRLPDKTIISAELPTPVGAYYDLVARTIDVVLGALAQAIPERVAAASFGTTIVTIASGVHPDTGAFFVAGWPSPGGLGATAAADGLVNAAPLMSVARTMSHELAETRYPVRVVEWTLRPDSGGAGRFRGAPGTRMTVEALGELAVTVMGDRSLYLPWGVQGGQPAAGTEVTFVLDGQPWTPPRRNKAEHVRLRPGDRFTITSPGGGGYGDPCTRGLERLHQDVRGGLVSAERLGSDYGAVLAADRVERAADRVERVP